MLPAMRTLRTILLWLGLLLLLTSVVLALALIESSTVFGNVSWRCEGPETGGGVECTVNPSSDALATVFLPGVTLPLVCALVGIGFLLGAIALGQTATAPRTPTRPAAQTPVPQPHGQPRQVAPQAPPGHPQHRG